MNKNSETDKEQIKKAILEAGNDPLLLADIEEVIEDFHYADFDKTVIENIK